MSTTYYLPVTLVGGRTQTLVPLNGNKRVEIEDYTAGTHEILNAPNTTPALGGKFPVVDYGNPTSNPPVEPTTRRVTYFGASAPADTVTLGADTPGEAGQGA